MILKCPFCHAEVPGTVKDCPACKERMSRPCPHCNETISVRAETCKYCSEAVAASGPGIEFIEDKPPASTNRKAGHGWLLGSLLGILVVMLSGTLNTVHVHSPLEPRILQLVILGTSLLSVACALRFRRRQIPRSGRQLMGTLLAGVSLIGGIIAASPCLG